MSRILTAVYLMTMVTTIVYVYKVYLARPCLSADSVTVYELPCMLLE